MVFNCQSSKSEVSNFAITILLSLFFSRSLLSKIGRKIFIILKIACLSNVLDVFMVVIENGQYQGGERD